MKVKEKIYKIRTRDVSNYINEMNINLILCIFLAVTMAFLLAFALYLIPKNSLLGVGLIGILLLATVIVFYFLLKNYNRFNRTLKKVIKKEDGTIFKIVGKKDFVYKNEKEKIHFSEDEILLALNNYIERDNTRSPYYGQGYLQLELTNDRLIKIPSIIFDEKRGYFKIKKIFNQLRSRYREKHIKSSEMLAHFYESKNLVEKNHPEESATTVGIQDRTH